MRLRLLNWPELSCLLTARPEEVAEQTATDLCQYAPLNQHTMIEEVLLEKLPTADRDPGLGLRRSKDNPGDA